MHLATIRGYVEAGYDEVYLSQMGSQHEEFFTFWATELRPVLTS